MISGAGWLSVGPGYRHYFSDNRILIDGSAAVSWRLYKMAQGRFELPKLASDHLIVGAQGMWQDDTQVNYFGNGPDSLEANRSQYRMQTNDVVGYGIVAPNTCTEPEKSAGVGIERMRPLQIHLTRSSKT